MKTIKLIIVSIMLIMITGCGNTSSQLLEYTSIEDLMGQLEDATSENEVSDIIWPEINSIASIITFNDETNLYEVDSEEFIEVFNEFYKLGNPVNSFDVYVSKYTEALSMVMD